MVPIVDGSDDPSAQQRDPACDRPLPDEPVQPSIGRLDSQHKVLHDKSYKIPVNSYALLLATSSPNALGHTDEYDKHQHDAVQRRDTAVDHIARVDDEQQLHEGSSSFRQHPAKGDSVQRRDTAVDHISRVDDEQQLHEGSSSFRQHPAKVDNVQRRDTAVDHIARVDDEQKLHEGSSSFRQLLAKGDNVQRRDTATDINVRTDDEQLNLKRNENLRDGNDKHDKEEQARHLPRLFNVSMVAK